MKRLLVARATGDLGKFATEVFTRQSFLVRALSCHKKLGKRGTLGKPSVLSQIGYFPVMVRTYRPFFPVKLILPLKLIIRVFGS